jgi:hypothetical protein
MSTKAGDACHKNDFVEADSNLPGPVVEIFGVKARISCTSI